MALQPLNQQSEKIDRYELLRKLATGGMADIFLAKQSGLEGFEKVVVIKRILKHLSEDEEFVSMFLDEARIAAKLSHPNVVQIYDLGRSNDTYYIAMEYVSGRNVQHLMNKESECDEKIPTEHVCKIIAGVCDGLYYAHSRRDYDGKDLNIVHRDISPQNILVSFAGGVKVVDFGIAKASTKIAQTRAGVLKGKYAYMSPEQVKGQTVDHRSDIFSLGLVMYEMLTGRRAFERESSLKTLAAIVQEKPLNPRELNPEVPMEVVKLLSKALEKNPDRRYKDAQEMQLALEDYLETSKKKSNNVRLSRYLKELFDDELNAEGGTLVVQGIGEVVIPTRAPDPSLVVEEEQDEVASQTLSKILGDNDDQTGLEDAEDSESENDKTIPVYDLASYERQRYANQADDSQEIDIHAPTTSLDAKEVAQIAEEARLIREREEASRQKARDMLAKVDSLADQAPMTDPGVPPSNDEWNDEKTDFQSPLSGELDINESFPPSAPELAATAPPLAPPTAPQPMPSTSVAPPLAPSAPITAPTAAAPIQHPAPKKSALVWVLAGLSILFLLGAFALGITALLSSPKKSVVAKTFRQVDVVADSDQSFVFMGKSYKGTKSLFAETGTEVVLKSGEVEKRTEITSGQSPLVVDFKSE